jgi:hypothetical protein
LRRAQAGDQFRDALDADVVDHGLLVPEGRSLVVLGRSRPKRRQRTDQKDGFIDHNDKSEWQNAQPWPG